MTVDPAQRLMAADLQSPEFLAGAAEGLWGQVTDPAPAWPLVLFWIAVPPRPSAPERMHLLLNAAGYRATPPTGTFGDPETGQPLDLTRRPKGREHSRFARVFRTDWEGGRAFYHPYDRVAANSHGDWAANMPRKVWTPQHSIVDYLDEFHALFQSEDYLGV